MTKQNQLFEAIGNIDDDIAANALKPTARRGLKKPLKFVLIAAAAAALSLLVGFNVYYKNFVEQNGKPLLRLNITLHKEIVFPSVEELIELGAFDPDDGTPGVNSDFPVYRFHTKTDPRTVIEKYNLNFIVNNNDNFTRANAEDHPELLYENSYFEEMYVRIMADFFKENRSQKANFMFGLIDKRLDLPVTFIIDCYFEELSRPAGTVIDEEAKYTLIELNNGEKALIEMRSSTSALAYFTYDGIVYNVSAGTDIDGIKQVLADLGVYALI